MTDIYDRATIVEEADRQQAIARQRAHNEGPDLRNVQCVDCDEPIDPKRRNEVRNCRRCIDCARIAEARHKLIKR